MNNVEVLKRKRKHTRKKFEPSSLKTDDDKDDDDHDDHDQ